MLPDIVAEDGLVPLHDRAVLVRRGDDLESSLLVDDEPYPAASEAADAGGLELGLEFLNAAEGLRDRLGQLADGGGGAARGHELPEEGVVRMAAAVVADGRADRLGNGGEVGDELVHRPGGKLGMILERIVQVVDVRGVVLVVMDFHRAGVDVGLECRESVGKSGKCVGHRLTGWPCADPRDKTDLERKTRGLHLEN